MQTYPVHYHVEYPTQMTRLQLLVRVLAFCALGILGISFGALFCAAFIALPVFAAARLGGSGDYLADDGPRVTRFLRWLAAVSAWVGLLTDRLPASTPDETIRIEVAVSGRPTSGSALWRVVTGLPSAFVLAILCWIGGLVWLWAALSILFRQRIGHGAFDYLVGLQRWSVRLLAYQASLVDEYPPFSFSDDAVARDVQEIPV